MSRLNHMELLKLHSIFLERNKELVLAIRDKKPRNVIASIIREIRQVYQLMMQQDYSLW